MKVLLTGGGGFLGAWIVRRLAARGIAVRVFDLGENRTVLRQIAGEAADAVEWVRGDVASTDQVVAAGDGCDAAVHLAALLTPACRANPVLGAQVNLIGTLNVLEAARAHGMKKVVYASSAGIFGIDDGETPYPSTLYGAFKLACEGAARAYWNDFAIPSVGFRPGVVYGPGRDVGLSAGPSVACREAVAGRPYTIGYTGSADLIHVDDVAAAFEAAVIRDFEGAHAFSLVGEIADVDTVIETIRGHVPGARIDATGEPIPMAVVLKPGDTQPVLGDLPRTPLADGIARTIAHYRAIAA
jgi:UDP-glucose 4-epimerase